MKIQNLLSPNGNPVPNQIEVIGKNKEAFQSYETLICVKVKDKIYLSDKHDYSRTTAKYRNIFLGKTSDQIKSDIKNGSIQVVTVQELNNIWES